MNYVRDLVICQQVVFPDSQDFGFCSAKHACVEIRCVKAIRV